MTVKLAKDNCIGSASSSGGSGSADVITATNITSATILKGDKVYIKDSSIVDFSQIRGFENNSCTVNDTTGEVSAFTTSHYIYGGLNQTFDFTKPWSFKTKFKLTSFPNTNQFIVCGSSTGSTSADFGNMGFYIYCGTSGGLNSTICYFHLSTDQDLILISNIAGSVLNKDYWLDVGWTGTEYYAKYSEDGISYEGFSQSPTASTTSCKTQSGTYYAFGYSRGVTSMYLRGSMYLKDTRFISNGVSFWSGYAYSADSFLTGTAKENIVSGATGNVETFLPSKETRNFEIVGNPTFSNNNKTVLCDASNYLYIPTNQVIGASSWEMSIKLNTGSTLWMGILNNDVDSVGFRIGCLGGIWSFLVSSGSSWINTTTYQGTYGVQTNTDYWLKFGFTGTKYYLQYSLDGETFIEDISYASTTKTGSGSTTKASNSTFYLDNMSISVNGLEVWTPYGE